MATTGGVFDPEAGSTRLGDESTTAVFAAPQAKVLGTTAGIAPEAMVTVGLEQAIVVAARVILGCCAVEVLTTDAVEERILTAGLLVVDLACEEVE